MNFKKLKIKRLPARFLGMISLKASKRNKQALIRAQRILRRSYFRFRGLGGSPGSQVYSEIQAYEPRQAQQSKADIV